MQEKKKTEQKEETVTDRMIDEGVMTREMDKREEKSNATTTQK